MQAGTSQRKRGQRQHTTCARDLFMKDELVRVKAADTLLEHWHKEAFKKAAGNWLAERICRTFQKIDTAT